MLHPCKYLWAARAALYKPFFAHIGSLTYIGRPCFIEGRKRISIGARTRIFPGIRMEGNHVSVDLQMRTNLPGLFACGDITGTPYQYIKAAGQGNVAALSAVSFLAAQK